MSERLTLSNAQTGEPGYRIEFLKQTEPPLGSGVGTDYLLVRIIDNRSDEILAVMPSVGLGIWRDLVKS